MKKKKGKKKKEAAGLPPVPENPLFVGVAWLLPKPKEGHAKGKSKKLGHADSTYGLFDRELLVSASSFLTPGRMVMVDQEVMQVLEVAKYVSQKEKKKGDKTGDSGETEGICFTVTVNRAKMGSQVANHSPPCPLFFLSAIPKSPLQRSPAPLELQDRPVPVAPPSTIDTMPFSLASPSAKVASMSSHIARSLASSSLASPIARSQALASPIARSPASPLTSSKGVRWLEDCVSPSQSFKGDIEGITPHPFLIQKGLTKDNLFSSSIKRMQGEGGFWKPVWPYSIARRHTKGEIEQRMASIMSMKSSFAADLDDGSRLREIEQEVDKARDYDSEEEEESELSRRKEFIFAVKEGDLEAVQELLENGMNPNLKGSDAKVKYLSEFPCLLLAAQYGRHDVVKCLINAKADLLAAVGSDTALSLAQQGDQWQEQRAGREGRTAGDYDSTVEILKKSIEEKAAQEQDTEALQSFLLLAIRDDWLALAKIVVQQGLNVNFSVPITTKEDPDASPWASRTPLMLTCRLGRIDMLDLLLDARANADTTDLDGRTALLEAVWAKQGECVRTLMDAKANVHTETLDGDTALMVAARTGQPQLVRALLARGARVGQRDACCEDAFDAAFRARRDALLIARRLPAHPNLPAPHRTPSTEHPADKMVPHSWGGRGAGEGAGRVVQSVFAGAKDSKANRFTTWIRPAPSPAEEAEHEAGAEGRGKRGRGRRKSIGEEAWYGEVYHGEVEEGPAGVEQAVRAVRGEQTLEVLHAFFLQRARAREHNSCDAYVHARIGLTPEGPWQGHLSTERVLGLNPRWNHLMHFDDTGIENMFLKLEMFDWDQIGEHAVVGRVLVPILDVVLSKNRTVYQTFDLLRGASASAAGGLMLKLQLTTPTTLRVLVEAGVNLIPLDRKAKKVSNCLEAAAKAGWDDVVRVCVSERHGDPNRPRNGRGIRPLMYAAACAQVSTVRTLLEGKADPNLADAEGATALMWAAAGRTLGAVKGDGRLDAAESEAVRHAIRVASLNSKDAVDPRTKWKHNQMQEQKEAAVARAEAVAREEGVELRRLRTVALLLHGGALPTLQDKRERTAAEYAGVKLEADTFLMVEWLWR